MSATGSAWLIVKLAAAGDVLLTTAALRALRRHEPEAHLAWLTTPYAAPLLECNADLDTLHLTGKGPAWTLRLLRWQRSYPTARVLLAHRSRRLRWMLRAAGWRSIFAFKDAVDAAADPGEVPFDLRQHRLKRLQALLAAAGVAAASADDFAPHLELSPAERAEGEEAWHGSGGPRWAIAPGGASNPWSAMPNRRWPAERFLALAQRALASGKTVGWIGGEPDSDLCGWLHARAPGSQRLDGHFGLRRSAALLAAADLVLGNDSLPLVMAHALRRPSLGLYGPTDAAVIHAPGQAWLQGLAGCGPCYDPRQGRRGRAYTCPHARCMEQIEVSAVWAAACAAGSSEAVLAAAGASA